MPDPALLQAISRLDQAVSHAEAALEKLSANADPRTDHAREERIRQALAELDALIESLDEGAHG